nr:acyl-CoA dehydrogenase family protein [Pseudomonas sp.]
MLDDDLRMLQDSAMRYLERSYSFEQRTHILARPEGFDPVRWKEMADLGWLALGLPESVGGFGNAASQVVLAEALGQALVVEPWLVNNALCAPLLAGQSDAAHVELASAVTAGSTRLALAAWEIQGRYDAFDVKTQARPVEDGWQISGSKTLVLGGGAADILLVLARTQGAQRDLSGLTLFAVPVQTAGVSIAALPTYDGMQTARVTFDRVPVPGHAVVGMPGDAWFAVEHAIDRATTMACGIAVGAMAKALDMTQTYLRERVQFGKRITDNQVIRHRLVDMLVAIEQSRAITQAAADRLDDDAPARKRAVSLAKAFVSSSGRKVGEESVQLHGAVGMTDEYAVGHYYKCLAASANLFGDAHWHHERLTLLESKAEQELSAS